MKKRVLLSYSLINLFKKAAIVSGVVLALGACGGGSSDNKQGRLDSWQQGVFPDASRFANKCENPRTGRSPITGFSYPDKRGSTTDENYFLRSWSNDTYLWYNEIVDRNPASYDDPIQYFNLLKTTAKTTTGADKDKFHFTYETDVWEALSETGVSYGYGIQFAFIRNDPPRELIVAYTEPGSPAALANIPRGTRIMKIDNVDLVYDDSDSGIDILNEGINPSAGNQVHTFTILKPGAETTQDVVLQSTNVTSTPVQNVKTITTDSGKVGYLTFNDHIATAEKGLVDAISYLQGQSITDLVVDLRYNGGGYLAIASQLAYMVAGSANTQGKVFEDMQFNDKHPNRTPVTGETLSPDPFYDIALGFSVGAGQALPTLNFSRVFVLTTGNTCSASEAFMNGLRGIGLTVIQIGGTTCGKPYGFYPEDNCGTTYFTVQFRGVNADNFGDYTDGFIPSATDNQGDRVRGCLLGDDFTHALGDQNERLLSAALYFREHNTCPVASASAIDSRSMKAAADSVQGASLNKHKALQIGWKKK